MPTRIRLQRFGKKGQPFYRIVVADSRAPRDGKFIENIGTYNPLTIPATIQINVERALYWLQVGAQPTDTARAILSYKGVLYKHHLQKGVMKQALTQEQADAKFKAWLEEKEQKIAQKIKDRELSQKESMKKKLKEEAEIKEKRDQEIAEKRAKELATKMKAEQSEAVAENTGAENESVVNEINESLDTVELTPSNDSASSDEITSAETQQQTEISSSEAAPEEEQKSE